MIAPGDNRRQVASGVYKRRKGTMRVITPGDKRGKSPAMKVYKRREEKRREETRRGDESECTWLLEAEVGKVLLKMSLEAWS